MKLPVGYLEVKVVFLSNLPQWILKFRFFFIAKLLDYWAYEWEILVFGPYLVSNYWCVGWILQQSSYNNKKKELKISQKTALIYLSP